MDMRLLAPVTAADRGMDRPLVGMAVTDLLGDSPELEGNSKLRASRMRLKFGFQARPPVR